MEVTESHQPSLPLITKVFTSIFGALAFKFVPFLKVLAQSAQEVGEESSEAAGLANRCRHGRRSLHAARNWEGREEEAH